MSFIGKLFGGGGDTPTTPATPTAAPIPAVPPPPTAPTPPAAAQAPPSFAPTQAPSITRRAAAGQPTFLGAAAAAGQTAKAKATLG